MLLRRWWNGSVVLGSRSEVEGSKGFTIEVALTESDAEIEHDAPSEHLL